MKRRLYIAICIFGLLSFSTETFTQVTKIMGKINEENKSYPTFLSTAFTLEMPYWETGVGIENIFKILRVDAIWRLPHLDHENIHNFGIFFSFQFVF